jgi:branched-chain amino acid transport system ATP-binding protein
MSEPILAIDGLETCYGLSQVLFGISLSIAPGEMVTLMGRNGMGKTTTVRSIMGLTPARAGRLRLAGADILGLPAYRVAKLGIGLVPEGRQIFPNLTVRENLDIGSYRRARPRRAHNRSRVFSLFPSLAERQNQSAGTLSGGEQQMLAIGRALMAEPKLLILDEPSLGLSPKLVEELFAMIRSLNRDGTALLLVEQNVVQSLEVAEHAYILDNGVFVLEGRAADLRNDPNLKRAYLGM